MASRCWTSVMSFFKQTIYLAVNFGIVIIILGYASWDEFSLAISKMSISTAIVTLIMLIMVLIVYYRLKCWHVWTIVLAFLALFGSGLELPPFFVLFPDHMSTGRVALTLAAVLLFWGIEKFVAKHEGSDNSAVGVGYSLVDSDEMITLDLDDKKKTVPKHT